MFHTVHKLTKSCRSPALIKKVQINDKADVSRN